MINIHTDPWLRGKNDFCVERNQLSSTSNDKVCQFIRSDTKEWDDVKIRQTFGSSDVAAILETRIPQITVVDKLAWVPTKDGKFSVKSGYHFWQSTNNNAATHVLQSNGWQRLWNLNLPHKLKIFLWRFCRNTIPVRELLMGKGVNVPGICPMCITESESMVHVFFQCNFAMQCWQENRMNWDMHLVESAAYWLLHKLETENQCTLIKVATVLWGIWLARNKVVWEKKYITPTLAMEWSSRHISEWKMAVQRFCKPSEGTNVRRGVSKVNRWKPPEEGQVKLNVDASVIEGADSFSIGMVIRDHCGVFLGVKL